MTSFVDDTSEKDAFAAQFTRHLTPLALEYSFEGTPYLSIITAFLFQLREYAFLVTSGHIRDDLHTILFGEKYSDQKISVVDSGAADASDFHAIPLDLDYVKQGMQFVDYQGHDYAYLGVREHYYELFLSNGIVPLGERFWFKDDPQCNRYVLAGVPAQWNITQVGSSKIEFYFCIKTFNGLLEKPEKMERKPAGTIFGEIPMDERLTHIGGMSGGPVFSVRVNDESKMTDYKLVGVQSSWTERKYIAASPLPLLVELINLDILKDERREA